MELDAIAAVVIGGTLLTGGSGYLAGSVLGVLVLGLIQTLISFDGTLSSWWTKIVIGLAAARLHPAAAARIRSAPLSGLDTQTVLPAAASTSVAISCHSGSYTCADFACTIRRPTGRPSSAATCSCRRVSSTRFP